MESTAGIAGFFHIYIFLLFSLPIVSVKENTRIMLGKAAEPADA